MLFRIRHESLYRYDVPVALGPHLLRLTPRAGGIRLRSQQLLIEPLPTAWLAELDALGNSITRVSFQGSTHSLRVQSEIELETLLLPALGLALPPLPWGQLTAPGGQAVAPSVFGFAQLLLQQAGTDPLAVLDHLTRTLFTSFDRQIRPTGAARAAAETLALRQGACRDLTVLFLEVCACWGIPGRFVSGYQAQAETPDGQRHLHAWAEVSLPGAGWRGWDATHGVRAAEGHVALCAAPTQAATMPIEGGFVFQGALLNSTLDHSVRISTQ